MRESDAENPKTSRNVLTQKVLGFFAKKVHIFRLKNCWGGGVGSKSRDQGEGSQKITFDHKGEGRGQKWPKKTIT